ncbi:MAG: gamma-glutamyl-gamma-aminobutyrate hydrolase family protein [Lachnospiraceae bacterium]|nr:gamma-glutamyl-gamma-aminobutyrate hydrolase family protein [Lachnospiraceae bacterium]
MSIHFVLIIGRIDSTKNYKNAVSGAGYIPVVADSTELLEKYRQHPTNSVLSRMDLLLLPGGGDISPDLLHVKNQGSRNIDRRLDRVQFAYFDYFLSEKKPILGICKGMQLINAGLGGTLIQDLDENGTNIHACIEDRDNRHSCTYTPINELERFPSLSLLKQLYQSSFLPSQINSAHHQCIDKLAPGLIAFSHAQDGTIEAFIHRSLPIIGLQWHPERLFYSEGCYLTPFLRGLADTQILG